MNTHNGLFTGIISVLETNKPAGGAQREREITTSRQMSVETSLPFGGRETDIPLGVGSRAADNSTVKKLI